MAFGQSPGPPASAAQLAELSELLDRAGFDSFREARHPYGLTQRQSNGKFTRGEADELIERLSDELGDADAPAGAPGGGVEPAASAGAAPEPEVEPEAVTLAFPDELLAEELTRRGWTCTPPA